METINHNMQEYTTAQAAKVVGVSVSRIRQLAREGLIEHKTFGRTLVITQNGVNQAKNRNTRLGRPIGGGKS